MIGFNFIEFPTKRQIYIVCLQTTFHLTTNEFLASDEVVEFAGGMHDMLCQK